MPELDDKQIEQYGYHQQAHDLINSQHLLVLMAAKRAREIQKGSKPLVEYQKEGYELFEDLVNNVKYSVIRILLNFDSNLIFF